MRITVVFAVLMCLSLCALGAENWSQFRGPNAQGHSDSTGLAVDPGNPANVVWKTAIHDRAWSSPVIWGNQVWLTTATEDGKQLFAICVDRESGKIIHDLKLFDVAEPQYAHPFNTYASPTPVIEEGRVYVTFGSPGTACLDTATGKVLWTRTDFVCNHYRGAGSSPILFEDLLIMHFDGSDYQYVVALDKRTGSTVWKTDRSIKYPDLGADGKPKMEGDLRKAFSTPVIAQVDGQTQLISLGSMALYGYEPRTGKELWRIEYPGCFSGSPIPIVGDGILYVCMGLSRGELWAIRPGGAGPGGLLSDKNVLWKITKNIPTRNSPVLVNGLLHLVDDSGMASCIDPADGKEVWRQRIKGLYSSSPVVADGRIYFFSEGGFITVIVPGRQYKALAESRIAEGFMASPAVAGKAMFVRSKTHLYRIEQR